VAPTNIRCYVCQFHITDECTGVRGRDHVTLYIHRLTDEYMGPQSRPPVATWPNMCWLTDEYNPYIHRLINKFSNFFTTAYFGCLSRRRASKTGNTYQNFLHIEHNSTHFMTIQHKMSYNCSKLLTSHTQMRYKCLNETII
jgi:hypothetical protein